MAIDLPSWVSFFCAAIYGGIPAIDSSVFMDRLKNSVLWTNFFGTGNIPLSIFLFIRLLSDEISDIYLNSSEIWEPNSRTYRINYNEY